MDKQKLIHTAAVLVVSAVGSWLLLRVFGMVLLPFAIGAAIAAAAEPLVKRLRLPRWLASAAGVTGLYVLAALAMFFLCRIVCRELTELAASLPQVAQSLAEPMAQLRQRLLNLAGRFPDGIGAALRESVENLFRNGAGLAERLYSRVFDMASGLLGKLPDVALFLLTALLSSFMLSAQLPKLLRLWREKVPRNWQHNLSVVGKRLKTTMGGWCKAQIKLIGITFLVLTAGFLLLHISYPLLLAAGIAILDALPVLGVGAVLIPWSIWLFLQGQTGTGIGMVCLYGAAALLRTALEPRLLGKQIGLDPLLTLLSIYAGYRFLGLAGMILFPIGAILGKQYWNHMEQKGETSP